VTKRENEITWRDVGTGGIVEEAGSASQYESGTWRSQRPIFDFNRCIKCGMCQLFCPEGCVEQNADGYFEANLFYCKGCGICARECWPRAITMVDEEE